MEISIMKLLLPFLAFMMTALLAPATLSQEGAKPNQLILKYLGTAGWEITNGAPPTLIHPYLSRINRPAQPGSSGHPIAGDTRRAYQMTDIATPDIATID